jgi:undecaprenyl-diphosphatase
MAGARHRQELRGPLHEAQQKCAGQADSAAVRPPRRRRISRNRIRLTHALLLGLVQGPAELLPVSSSGHLVLLGSDDKAFEVFLHAGTAAALLLALPVPRPTPHTALTLAPAAVAGLVLEKQIEGRLGRRSVGFGQVAGGAMLLVADRAAAHRGEDAARSRDALLIGLAQACALVPGVSRNGATITAARLLGFRRDAAARMSRDAALPVILGATALKLVRMRGRPPSAAHVGGFAAAFVSSLVAAGLIPRIDRLPLAPIGVYRIALGLAAARSA